MTSPDSTEGQFDPTRPDAASLEDVVADFIMRREAGEEPHVEDYLARFPRHAERLARVLSYDTAPPTRDEGSTLAAPMRDRSRIGAQRLEDAAPRIGPFRILAHVSTAGGGTVYRASDERTGAVVALKTLDGRGVLEPRDLERFRREAQVLRGLDLVNVVPVLDSGIDGGRHWIAMKWIEGETLRDLRAKVADPSHRLHDLRERARLVARIAHTFAEIHGFDLVHRDVKPSNVMTDRTGVPMIIDFGIARADTLPELTQTDDVRMGTPRYLAPEIVSRGNAAASPSVDIYGLGLCLYELATGAEPFAGVGRDDLYRAIAAEGPVRPRVAAPKLPFDYEAVILRAIEIDPARRYPTMAAFADDLDRVARGDSPDARTLARARPWARFVARRKREILVASIACVVLVAASGFAYARFVAPELAVRALMRDLAPYAWLPPDALAGAFHVPDAAVEALARGSGSDPARRLAAAWLLYGRGRLVDAGAVLGAAAPGDSFAVRLLRDHLAALVHDRENPQPVEGTMPGGDRLELRRFQLEARTDQPRDAKEFDAAFARIATASPPATAKDRIVAAALEWSALPTDPAAERGAGALRIRAHASEALDDAETAPAARYLLGALALLEGRPAEARAAFAACRAARPAALGALYLEGIAAVEAGDGAAAVGLLEEARKALPESHRAWPRLMGRLAQAYAAAGRRGESEAALSAWKNSGVWTRFTDRVVPLALAADFAEARGDATAALSAYEESIELVPGWAPAYARAAEIAARSGDRPRAEQFRAMLREQETIPVPRDAESFLRMELRGLRPPDRGLVGAYMIERTGEEDR